MAHFFVKLSEIEFVIGQMENMEQYIGNLYEQLEKVKKDFQWSNKGLNIFGKNLVSISAQLNREKRTVASMKSNIKEIVVCYKKADKNAAENTCKRDKKINLSNVYDKTTTFDDDKENGTYGADQGNMNQNKKGIEFLGFQWFEDEELYNYIREHENCKNLSSTEIAKLIKQIAIEGCGYVTLVNNIYMKYEGHEEEFEKIFEFPMYDNKGKANYDYLLADLYINTDDKYYIDEMNGEVALLIDRVKYYLDNDKEQEFIEKYGCELLLKDKSLNPKARQKILAEYQEQSVVTYKHEGNTVGSLDNRFRHYMDEKGILYSTDIKIYDTAPETTEINRLLYEGKNVNICEASCIVVANFRSLLNKITY